MDSDLEGSTSWKATDQILDRAVHVRILDSANAAQALDAARRAALVSDPRLVRILDVGNHEGVGYVVTEHVAGPSLAELVARGPLTSDQARSVVGEAAAALEVARRRGVHHLALRPSVVHITPEGRLLLSGLAMDGALLGHGLGDAAATTRSDAIGLVRLLYTALTGHWPEGDSGIPATGLPAAPVVDGVLVAPADLAANVRADLDTLCAVTLGPHDDGPRSPAELVRELEPWGEIRTLGPLDASAEPAATILQEPVRGMGPESDAESTAQMPLPGRVERQSVRSAFNDQPTAGSGRPGTPPPAAPRGRGAFPAGAGASGWPAEPTRPPATPAPAGPPPRVAQNGAPQPGLAQARPTGAPIPVGTVQRTAAMPSGPAAPPPTAPPPSLPTSPFDFSSTADDDETVTTRRFDPTKLVLLVVGALLVIGVIVALTSLFRPISGADDDAGAAPAVTSGTQDESEQSPTTEQQQSPSAEPSPSRTANSGAAPVIASATTIDPSDDDGEYEDVIGRAFDGDPATFWKTHTYNNANFLGPRKPKVGIVLTLDGSTTVSSVTLNVNGTGGQVEVREGTAADPESGSVLASGAMSADTVLEFSEPVTTDSLVIWFTELPTATSGGYLIELTEITLS
ncbi:protein kinase family protein [Cellulomonas cellasea]|uniref:protein kinase family protein n=1 Tax=Cellulomonas cellasea TaxID=43670 RepID=UPI0025A3178F|nr:protein kinase family protein [Cellulomonas cellasea]MDM8085190.1 protein kinase family protein [Cellulomonas cellasea]